MKKRILHLIGSFHQGGSERQAIALMKLLKDEGSFDIFAATLNNEGILRSEAEAIGLPAIPEFPLTSFYNANFVRQVRRCAAYLREQQIDLIHTHDFYTNVFGMAAAKVAGLPSCVASKRETGGMRSGAQEFVEKLAFKRAVAIIVNSAAVRDHLTDRSIPGDKLHIVYNGIDVERFTDPIDRAGACAAMGLPADADVRFVTLVANLRHEVKNVPMFLRAGRRVLTEHPHARFVIAGEGDLAADLKAMAAGLGVAENVDFIGRCSNVPALLGISYACVLTSTAEGFSNSILEYMAAGKPVVATNVGGAAEAIAEGETGYLVASDDDAAMAGRLNELLADSDKAERFGYAGRREASEKFSTGSQLRRTLEVYEGLK